MTAGCTMTATAEGTMTGTAETVTRIDMTTAGAMTTVAIKAMTDRDLMTGSR
jgi:hypothetical protein